MHVWYNNLKPNSIEGFNDLWAKLVARFSTNIPVKKTPQSFLVLSNKRESIRRYIFLFDQ